MGPDYFVFPSRCQPGAVQTRTRSGKNRVTCSHICCSFPVWTLFFILVLIGYNGIYNRANCLGADFDRGSNYTDSCISYRKNAAARLKQQHRQYQIFHKFTPFITGTGLAFCIGSALRPTPPSHLEHMRLQSNRAGCADEIHRRQSIDAGNSTRPRSASSARMAAACAAIGATAGCR